jgi:hypothetical protein
VLAGKTLAALAVVMLLLLMTAGERNRLADSNSNTSVRFLGISLCTHSGLWVTFCMQPAMIRSSGFGSFTNWTLFWRLLIYEIEQLNTTINSKHFNEVFNIKSLMFWLIR